MLCSITSSADLHNQRTCEFVFPLILVLKFAFSPYFGALNIQLLSSPNMGKRKGSAGALDKADTKRLKEVANVNTKGAKSKRKSDAEDVASVNAKNTRKVRCKSQTPRCEKKVPVHKVSKYFQDSAVTVSDDKEGDGDNSNDNSGMSQPGSKAALSDVVKKEEKDEESDEEEEEEWEDVEDLADSSCTLPSQPVEIEIEAPEQTLKRQRSEKKKADFETYLKRMMNRFNKELLVDMHKVHLLCLVANGMFRNRLCSDPELMALALSLLPAHMTTTPPEEVTTSFLSSLLKWFGATFTLNSELPDEPGQETRDVLEKRLEMRSARDHQEMTHLFLLVLRSLHLFCRLVLSLQPLPLKAPPAKSKAKTAACPAAVGSEAEPLVSPGTKRSAGSRTAGPKRGGKSQRKEEEDEEDEVETEAVPAQRPKNKQRRKVASKVCYKEESSEGEEPSEGEEFQVSEEDDGDSEGEFTKKLGRKSRSKSEGSRSRGKQKGEAKSEGSRSRGKRKGRADDQEVSKEREGCDEWLEVYLERLGHWVCLDVMRQCVGQPLMCSRQATQPLSYVLAVDGDGYVKDLGSRYDHTWMTLTRKRRVDQDWWEETLQRFCSPASQRERQEDEELQSKLLNKPLPVSVTDYKNHPLYALKRHLLKYEALYPPTAAILGYCRGEPVYSRDCVHTLHSRDTWLKEARTVRLGEVPYKMVKGFSNRSRKARMLPENREVDDLALFGRWQTEEYQPPVAVGGKVPRNDFGNVYMFQPCMRPVGCVHLRLPNLHRVARKLELDCAAAVTGFDFHGGFSHPVTDGYIVCEEHREVLEVAWEAEQELQEQKEREKREKRVLANWTLLVKGLLIRERLRHRYGAKGQRQATGQEGLSSEDEDADNGHHAAAESLATSWPQNRQEGQEHTTKPVTRREQRGKDKHLFPFEKV